MAVKNNIKLIFSYLKLNLKKEAQYKTSFIMQIIMMTLNDAFFILQWLIIFNVIDNIDGYGFKEVMLIWALSSGSFGVSHLLFANAFNVGNIIYEGKLDVFLTQPKNILINICCSRTSVSAIGDIIYTYIVLIIIKATWWWYIVIIPIIVLGGLIFASMSVTFSTLSFYIKQGSSVANVMSTGCTLTGTYPSTIFKGIIKIILYTIIPVGFMVFIPSQYIFFTFNIWALLTLIGATILWIALAFITFNIGLKRYTSSSLMNGRL